MWRLVRTGLLLYLLLMVAGSAWLTRSRTTDWNDTLWVSVHPINGDGSAVAAEYIASLVQSDLEPVAEFFAREAEYYDVALERPVRVDLATEIEGDPPLPPAGRNLLSVAWWSLRLRYWAFRNESGDLPADINVFVRYFDPESNPRLAHSLGLQKGLIGVVNAFASRGYAGSNNVVIAHELLHTVGAMDKYDEQTGQPDFPHGYAEPELEPLYPQSAAEIMGGRIPLSSNEARMPRGLEAVVIGATTAAEILWEN